ncbi:P-loop containing nucleoside triphosphate hydrolase protein [Glomus cerebriforme]|uniref:P-loop containing nucleoside triphosphate hydrolase protein n=1 Tax=Glomus cerebriforme TaxID=658196 RepID=A0A397T1R8_9GLOM|nr:P-loop containing nucleoside triphosphate hydrolase protein [Glomus cerebriforme]
MVNYNSPKLIIIREKENIRNLLIVGRTGSGKSTLANVLTGTDDFKESGYTVSETKGFQKATFDWQEKKYRVVDTIGVGDTQLSAKEVLYKIIDGIYSMPDGIYQVLFVVDGRFTAGEIKTFRLIKDSIDSILSGNSGIDKSILDYITLVRTKFTNFRNNKECETDKEKMIKENSSIAEVVNSCRDIIHVDNPPIDITQDDSDSEDTKINNGNARKKARKKLLGNLDAINQEKYFKLKAWDELYPEIAKYMADMSKELSEEVENNPELQLLVQISSNALCLIL